MAFTCRIPVAYGDVDYARIVYYPRFLHYVHLAMERFFAEVAGVPYADVLGREGVGYPAVKVEAEFHAPIAFGDEIDMTVTVERLGARSVRWRNEGRRVRDGVLAFVVRNTTVAVEMDAFVSRRIPAGHRAALRSILAEDGEDVEG